MTSQDNTQQLNYLHEMGVQSWVLRKQPSTDVVEITVSTAPVDVTEAKVNEIAEVVDLRMNELDSAPNVGTDESAKFIQGVASLDGELLIIVDLNKLLSDDQWAEMSSL